MRWMWVDRFLTLQKGVYARAVKNVTLAEEHLHDYSPYYPMMPAPLMIESMAQTGGVLAGYSNDFRHEVILAKIEEAAFGNPVVPGDQVTVEARLLESREEGCRVACRCSVDGEEVASATIMFVNLDRSKIASAPKGNFVFTEELVQLLRINEAAEAQTP
jgi:3-hydroxyacyl-[acyl-carrier-protein] dehydratase